jgi:hypothetical protein
LIYFLVLLVSVSQTHFVDDVAGAAGVADAAAPAGATTGAHAATPLDWAETLAGAFFFMSFASLNTSVFVGFTFSSAVATPTVTKSAMTENITFFIRYPSLLYRVLIIPKEIQI